MLRQLGAALVTAVLLGTSCGYERSHADEQFVADMVPHHVLGLHLISDAQPSVRDVRLRRLVFEMSGYHHKDLHLLEQWQRAWELPSVVDFPGHLSRSELATLRDSSDESYDVIWLDLMLKHHLGALEIARQLLRGDGSSSTREIALRTIEVQTGEIAEMNQILSRLCSMAPHQCDFLHFQSQQPISNSS
jgi:uncharacterized protein (DUF305 family)